MTSRKRWTVFPNGGRSRASSQKTNIKHKVKEIRDILDKSVFTSGNVGKERRQDLAQEQKAAVEY